MVLVLAVGEHFPRNTHKVDLTLAPVPDKTLNGFGIGCVGGAFPEKTHNSSDVGSVGDHRQRPHLFLLIWHA